MTYLIIPILLSFFITLFFIPKWIKKAKQIGLFWEDMNKFKSEKVAGSGGLIATLSFVISVFFYIAFKVLYLHNSDNIIQIFAILTVALLTLVIGIVDDLLGWHKGGLSKRTRIILVILSSIPLIAINAGKDTISLPFIGIVNLGLIYPLFLIPLAIVATTTTFNFLAGFNGLEAGQGIILLSSLSLVAFLTGSSWLSLVSLCMVASLLAFLFYNFVPAKIFPGNSLTYPVGSLIAIMAILGNFEKIAIFFFIPYILEMILKLRGNLVKQSFGKPNPDGSLDLRYNKIYGLEHLSIYLMQKLKIKPTEKKVVCSIWAFQILIIILGFIIFRQGIFI
jgi:UDP-N-acetylglucosamine--dolichyl-phosphate N-acetylglucosaminephosphotransferase